jgi:hypothetical protein
MILRQNGSPHFKRWKCHAVAEIDPKLENPFFGASVAIVGERHQHAISLVNRCYGTMVSTFGREKGTYR